MYLGTVAGNVELSGDFTGNFATDGGAVHVRWVRKGGKYVDNTTFMLNDKIICILRLKFFCGKRFKLKFKYVSG